MRKSAVQRARGVKQGLASLMALASLGAGLREAEASAPAWLGAEGVRVSDESAVLVWEAETKVEHLIQSFTFEGPARTFALLVPVPSTPTISAADEAVFEELERFWQHRRPVEPTYSFGGFNSALLSAPTESMSMEPPVQVLASTRVAGLDAVVLDGHSFVAVGDWLRENGFEYREELNGWLEPYVRAGYPIVAFKYAKGAAQPQVGSRAIRLSFSAPRPFYPYREPSDASEKPRSFRLYAVGATSFDASFTEGGGFEGAVRYSGPLRDVKLTFARVLTPWATFYEESSRRSRSGDLSLSASATPRLVQATPRVVQEAVMVPVELLALVLVGGVVGAARLRRGKVEDEELAEQE